MVERLVEQCGELLALRLPEGIRHRLTALVGGMRTRIRSGPNRGLHWSVVSAGRGAAAGTFERERVANITQLLRSGDCLWDIGAHKGYITLASATRVGDSGHVYAFEPAPQNLAFLRRHIEWNGVHNVTVMPYAVSSSDGTSRFGGSGSSITYRLGQGEHDVTVRSIESLLREGVRSPTVLKIDVEGNESEVVRGAITALPRDVLMFIAIHSREQYDACVALLTGAGMRVVSSADVARQIPTRDAVWDGDPDILAIGPDRSVDDALLTRFKGGTT